jgi:predicted ester cyclase
MLRLIVPFVAILIVGSGLVPGRLSPAAASQASPAASPAAACPTTTLEENKALVRRYFEEAHNEPNPAVVADLLSDDFVRHNAAFPQQDQPPGTADDVDRVESWLAMFPDLQISIEALIAEGDLVTAFLVWHGTQDGPIPQWDSPATGRSMEREAINIWRVACGRLTEAWVVADNLTMLRQLGIISDEELATVDTPTVATPVP